MHLALRKVGTEASPEELKKAMAEIMPEYRKAYEEVKSLGGLYIIGSERHESRRIDNQLRGRSGRQGDPGVSQFYISLDDPLMRLFAKEGLKEMIGRLGLKDGEPIHHKMLDNAIENAQKRVEERNFEIRKRLLEYDDVLNDQRNFIYSERDRILEAEDLSDRVIDNSKELAREAYEAAAGDKDKFIEYYQRVFSSAPDPELGFDIAAIEKAIEDGIRDKEAKVGKPNFNSFIRYVYLRNIDKRWVDHLDALEDLREAASLMSYAQKNPLVEYKNTASEAFDEMIGSITEAVCRTVMAVKVTVQPRPAHGMQGKMQATHQSPGPSLQQRPNQPISTAVTSRAQAENTTIVRTQPKVGRNDPCPCGSGKKYKNCCGKNW